MTITFFSNFLNHHQLPLCKEFIQKIGEGNFHFVACERIHLERTKMGYEDMNEKYAFVVRAYESDEQMQKAVQLASNSDVAIIGSAPLVFQEIRAKENKLTFLFRERILKNGAWHRFIPTTARSIYNGYTRYRNLNFYILCASAYAADDFSLCGFPREKCLKWGYFPELFSRPQKTFDKLRLLWCGRMVWWKHPEDAVEVAHILSQKKVDFEMTIVGDGERHEAVQALVYKYDLQDKIHMCGFMKPAEIRELMKDSNLYLFTSGKQEGWGVVLNEAMNSGCVVIANKYAGSTPFLIEEGVNGIIYDGSRKALQKAVDVLIETNTAIMSHNAYSSIEKSWNAKNAVNSLLEFVTFNYRPLQDGPCSLA